MVNNKLLIILTSLYLQIIWPLELLEKLFLRNYGTGIEYILLLVNVLLIFYFLFTFCYWEYTSIYLRYIYFIFIIIGISSLIHRLIFIPSIPMGRLNDLSDQFNIILSTIIFLIIDIGIFLSKVKKRSSFNLSFPFRNGKFLVIDGGDGRISYFANYHYYGWKFKKIKNYDSMRFATDIIKLNKYGTGGRKMLNPSNNDFHIFGEKVYSPIEGEVVKVLTSREDNIPYKKLPNHSGNQITIKNGNYYVTLYHFRKDSIVVELGQKLEVGDYLGQVGNSGYSTRPHLHIQVVYSEDDNYWLGKGIPIIFNNIYPTKNSIINVK